MSTYTPKNYEGKVLSGPLVLSDEAFGTGEFDENCDPIVAWKKYRTEFADENGFDTRNEEENGKYYIRIVLPRGTHLVRYGYERGMFTAPVGTPYEMLSLPYKKDTVEYHEYMVVADELPVVCIVNQGKVAPMFNSNGGGVQYMHLNATVKKLVDKKILERLV